MPIRTVATIAMLALATPAAAQAMDWEKAENRISIDGAMRNFASNCASLDFTKGAPPPTSVMEKKLYSHFLLQDRSTTDAELRRWAGYLNAMREAGKDGARYKAAVEAAADALIAADVDPASEARAKAKYLEALKYGMQPIFDACTAAAREPFLSQYYLSGTGTWGFAERLADKGWAERGKIRE